MRTLRCIVLGFILLFACPDLLAAQTSTPLPPPTPEDNVYIPSILRGPPTPETETEAVFGLVGILRPATARTFSNYLTTAANDEYGIVGETPAVEQEIDRLRTLTRLGQVKVWGTLYRGRTPPLLVAQSILPVQPVEITRVPLVAHTEFNMVSLYAAPELTATRLAQVTPRNSCQITGSDTQQTWWLLACDNGVTAWGYARLFRVHGDTSGVPVIAAPDVQPPPTGTPTPTQTPLLPTATSTLVVSPNWVATYFANRDLAEPAIATSILPDIHLDWETGSPGVIVPPDNFSIRYERTIETSPGYYRFTAAADDGIRVFLDDQPIIDEWHGATGRTYVAGRMLRGGPHRIRVEYFEGGGQARVRFQYEFISDAGDWTARYYNNINLFGQPAFTQPEPAVIFPLDYDWGTSAPIPGIVPIDHWSARWEGTFAFNAGNYAFRARADDGVRVYIDGQLVLDGWRDGEKEVRNTFFGVGEGEHTIRVDYYERFGAASVRVWWYIDPNAAFDQ